ncbi:MAG: DNA-binding response regulator, AraC family [Polyangiaceae bacterium]|jgi:DNA-binding response OmpR family regulator|nr:DNA-binding response regulator, AraC family [Polyangiaceae bacterium]
MPSSAPELFPVGHAPRATVLIVEDDEDARDSVAEVLRDEGFEVLTAGDGIAALELLSRIPPPSAVVLDLSLPRMGGLELLERVRAQEALANLHVCVLSGQPELPSDVELAISKPLLVHRLVQIQKWLDECFA